MVGTFESVLASLDRIGAVSRLQSSEEAKSIRQKIDSTFGNEVSSLWVYSEDLRIHGRDTWRYFTDFWVGKEIILLLPLVPYQTILIQNGAALPKALQHAGVVISSFGVVDPAMNWAIVYGPDDQLHVFGEAAIWLKQRLHAIFDLMGVEEAGLELDYLTLGLRSDILTLTLQHEKRGLVELIFTECLSIDINSTLSARNWRSIRHVWIDQVEIMPRLYQRMFIRSQVDITIVFEKVQVRFPEMPKGDLS